MITVIVLNFERIGQEEYKTIPYTKNFSGDNTINEILKWIKLIDPNKTIADAYFSNKNL
jgi:hypothetical protein